mmetsp:Transcript_37735/g.93771  ORF Transcript_37735/g.93771 Transcript_37735/m.93771 type:complete len:366 (-) Transcript_37735:511-1608(-)
MCAEVAQHWVFLEPKPSSSPTRMLSQPTSALAGTLEVLSCAVVPTPLEMLHDTSDSTTQSDSHARRRRRLPGSRAQRELLDSAGFALQWNRGFTAFHLGEEADHGNGSSDSAPDAAKPRRQCLRLHIGGEAHASLHTSVNVGDDFQAVIPPHLDPAPCSREAGALLSPREVELQLAHDTARRLTVGACGFEDEAAERYLPEPDDLPDKLVLDVPPPTAAGLAAAQPWWMGAKHICVTCGRCFKTKHGCAIHTLRFCKGPQEPPALDASEPRGPVAKKRGRKPKNAAAEVPGEGGGGGTWEMEDVYQVECLVSMRVVVVRGKRRKQYLVRWEGYSDKHNTWEDQDRILDDDLIDDFEKRNGKTTKR